MGHHLGSQRQLRVDYLIYPALHIKNTYFRSPGKTRPDLAHISSVFWHQFRVFFAMRRSTRSKLQNESKILLISFLISHAFSQDARELEIKIFGEFQGYINLPAFPLWRCSVKRIGNLYQESQSLFPSSLDHCLTAWNVQDIRKKKRNPKNRLAEGGKKWSLSSGYRSHCHARVWG